MDRSRGVTAWVMHRVTAGVLVLALAVHVWFLHYSNPSELIAFDAVSARLKTALFLVVDFSLLAAALYHGLNGVRNVALDYGPGPRARRWMAVTLWTAGVALFLYGAYALVPFIVG